MEILAFIAVIAIYIQWRFASPFLPNPTLKSHTFIVRHSPLILFTISGLLISIGLKNFNKELFLVALLIGLGIIFVAFIIAYRNSNS